MFRSKPVRRGWAGLMALALWPMLGWSQTSQVDASQTWRDANQLVARFRRGHADWLKWEQNQVTSPGSPNAPDKALHLSTPESAVELIWKANPDASGALFRLVDAERALVVAGRWAELDPALNGRVEGLYNVIELAASARRAWLQATASKMVLVPMKHSLEAAQLSEELGQRMVAVGNWSTLSLAPYQLARANAQLNWHRAQYTALKDQTRLLKLLQLSGLYDTIDLPDALPAVLEQVMRESEFRLHLQKIQTQVNALRRDRHREAANLAYQAYLGSHAVATIHQNELVPLRNTVADETQLHYNGMLKSTWELLAQVQSQAQARVDLINAQRDFALACVDLQLALSGEEPEGLTSLGASTTDAAPNGH